MTLFLWALYSSTTLGFSLFVSLRYLCISVLGFVTDSFCKLYSWTNRWWQMSVNWFVQNTESFRNKASDSLNHSLNQFVKKLLIHSGTKQVTDSLNHSLNQFIPKKCWFILEQNNRLSDSLNHLLNQYVEKRWLIQEWNKWLSDSLKHSLNQFVQKCWFIQKKTKKQVTVTHWISHKINLFKYSDSFSNYLLNMCASLLYSIPKTVRQKSSMSQFVVS